MLIRMALSGSKKKINAQISKNGWSRNLRRDGGSWDGRRQLAVSLLTPEIYVVQRDFLTKDIVAELKKPERRWVYPRLQTGLRAAQTELVMPYCHRAGLSVMYFSTIVTAWE